MIRQHPDDPYEKYLLYRALRRCARGFERLVLDRRLDPRFDDIEGEVTYLLIREHRPQTVVEISPGGGWSTSWILSAIKHNASGRLYSYDLTDRCTGNVPSDLSEGRWAFHRGDVKKNLGALPAEIDYLFLDSEHSADFARWYIRNLFPRLKSGSPVSVHDVFLPSDFGYTEASVILQWLRRNGIEYFTASPSNEKAVFNEIASVKNKLGIGRLIQPYEFNSAVFFLYEQAFTTS